MEPFDRSRPKGQEGAAIFGSSGQAGIAYPPWRPSLESNCRPKADPQPNHFLPFWAVDGQESKNLLTTIKIGNSTFDVDPHAHQRFWKRVARAEWEPETFAIPDRCTTKESLFLDIGSWIGATALYGVQRANRCLAFEPDPVAFADLKQNVATNAGRGWARNLQIHQCAVNKDGASLTLGGGVDRKVIADQVRQPKLFPAEILICNG